MPAEVETMFYVRETPWHGLGTNVGEALSSKEALAAAGLDWNVVQKKIYTEDWDCVPGFYANVRDSDNKVLGVVTHRYRIVQNREAFAFTDGLLGKGVRYETAGSLREGRKTWILARLPKQYRLADDRVLPYLVFSNSHDGSGSIKAAMEAAAENMPEGAGPYIMTNTKGINGFSTVLYPGVLESFTGFGRKNLYVLPSSVHEALLLPADGAMAPQELQEMVREVNGTVVEETDILSDTVYYYDRQKNGLSIAGEEEKCVRL